MHIISKYEGINKFTEETLHTEILRVINEPSVKLVVWL